MSDESKVVSFEKLQTRRQENAKSSPNRLFVECRTLYIGAVGERLSRLFGEIDDELFALSEKADNILSQSQYFDAMRYLRREGEGVKERCLQGLVQVYDAFWRNQPLPIAVERRLAQGQGGLSLLEEEAFEENLAINGMIEKGDNLYQKDIDALGKRFLSLLGKTEGTVGGNPVSPKALCGCFGEALSWVSLDLKIKLLIYKIYDKQVLGTFGSVYQELNGHLIKAGILPALKNSPAYRSGKARGVGRLHPATGGAEKSSVSADAQGLDQLKPLLAAWRKRNGISDNFSSQTGFGVGGEEVLGILGQLQHRPGGISPGEKEEVAQQRPPSLTGQITGRLQGGRPRCLEPQLKDILDMVGMLFLHIMDDPRLPASVKALIASLQIPIAKVAVMDNAFFVRKNHPARLLLNSLAQAGMGLDDGMEADNAVYLKIEAVIQRVLVEFNRDSGLFREVLEDFAAFAALENRRNRQAEERIRKATQCKERVRKAKQEVAYVMADRFHTNQLPPYISSFLCNAWKDVMVVAWLRRPKEPDEWANTMAMMDRLIEVFVLGSGSDRKMRDYSETLELLDKMKNHLENLSYEQPWAMEWFERLKAGLVGQANFSQGAPGENESVDTAIKDQEFAALLQESLSRIEKERKAWDNQISETAMDEFKAKALSLEIGQWLEFTETCRRAKLVWKSEETGAFVFMGGRGTKLAEMKLEELADCLRNERVRAVEDAGLSLMDRAFSKVMGMLETP